MQLDNVDLVCLSDYEKVEDIAKHKLPSGLESNGLALLFSQGSNQPLALERDLALLGLDQLSSTVSSMDSIHSMKPDGEIDSELKAFLTAYAQIGIWALNSTSVARSDLKCFEEFDRIDLKQKLMALANQI